MGKTKQSLLSAVSFLIKKSNLFPIPFMFLFNGNWMVQTAGILITGGMFSAEQRISMNEESGSESKTLEQEAKSFRILPFTQGNLNGKKRQRLSIFRFLKMMRLLKPKV